MAGHKYNIHAFLKSGSRNRLLPDLYEKLIAIELALKDKKKELEGSWPAGHGIIMWIRDHIDIKLSKQLHSSLSALYCTNIQGDECPVSSSMYPGIRYLRHKDDFPAPQNSSSDEDLQRAMELAEQIIQKMTRDGYFS